ncbi:MAG: hypothetical protein A2X93_04290 [Deltaproteobacteria bacterium GWC2_56_8]|nr:MAG: hypothetical protein A2X99_00645 [Deltaproteobacteria bacterium GWB2_55_19]OGP38512.1 MAG: hypothetical protein A2X93_04290 [Deltaproteobacteria bacterium GWC2_56_8]HAO93130.1 hypothetical protein [Deltaproteobacteria bacterium]
MYYLQIFSIIGSLALFAIVIDFIRRGLLKEKYSVLWLASAVVIMALSVKKELLDSIAGWLGIAYPPSLLFLVAFIFVLLITLHFSVVISLLHEKNKAIAQELALMKNALKEAGIDVPGKARGEVKK